jgi:hypothetical protein
MICHLCPTCALLGGSKTSVTCPLSEGSCGFEGVVGLWDDGFRPAPIIEITGSDDHDEGRILQPNPGCELTARHRSRHPMIGENQVYRSPGRQILPSLVG